MTQPISLHIFHRLLLPVALLVGTGPLFAQKTYVGSDTCQLCHSEHGEWMKGSVHEKPVLKLKGGESVAGCEACHGPGSAHVEDMSEEGSIITFREETSKTGVEACLACHDALHSELNYRRSDHIRRNVSCAECHAVTGSQKFHQMRSVENVMRGQQPELCYSCHAAQRGEFLLPYHHPVEEQFMGCTECHDPHGTFTLRQLKTRHTESVCSKCHEDAAGPFIYEHAAVRSEGCQGCHQPHGSTNPKMLTRFQVQFLCLECHTNTPTFHDLTKTEFQNCTVCHSRIHGSNLNRHFLE